MPKLRAPLLLDGTSLLVARSLRAVLPWAPAFYSFALCCCWFCHPQHLKPSVDAESDFLDLYELITPIVCCLVHHDPDSYISVIFELLMVLLYQLHCLLKRAQSFPAAVTHEQQTILNPPATLSPQSNFLTIDIPHSEQLIQGFLNTITLSKHGNPSNSSLKKLQILDGTKRNGRAIAKTRLFIRDNTK